MPTRPTVTRSRSRLWLALVLLLIGAGLTVVRFVPFYLPRADPVTAPPVEEPAAVFGYATLTNPLVRFVVVGRIVPSEPARLEGWRRVERDLVRDPDASVRGRLFTVRADGLRRLDRYERAGVRYARGREVLADGQAAWVYRLLPGAQ